MGKGKGKGKGVKGKQKGTAWISVPEQPRRRRKRGGRRRWDRHGSQEVLEEVVEEEPGEEMAAKELGELDGGGDMEAPMEGEPLEGEQPLEGEHGEDSEQDQWRGHIARPKTAFSAGRPVPHVYTGVIKNISKVRRLGFILCGETFKMYGRDILVEPRELEKLEENQKVTFMVKLQEGRAMGYNLSPLKERPAQPSGKDLGSKLLELGQQWRNLRRQAPEPRAGPKLRTELTVSCSIPKAMMSPIGQAKAVPKAAPKAAPKAGWKELKGSDSKKRNFQELFEKTKAGLEELKKRRETRHGELPKASAKIQAVPLHSEAQPKVLLLDVEADSASLMEAMISEILGRPGVRQIHFAQPAGCTSAPYRAEILGLPIALLEVQTHLQNTLEHGAIRIVGMDKPRFEAERLCVTVKGLQESFGQGGACGALMCFGRVLQWNQRGNEVICWLASAEAVWTARQFLHGRYLPDGSTMCSVVPDQFSMLAVSRWLERQDFTRRGHRTEQELTEALLNEPAVIAAKVRLEDFFSYVTAHS